MEEKNELIKELFKLWENLYEVGEIYAGYGFTDNYKRLEAKVKNLTIPDVSNQRELLSCDNGCDWQLKGIQTNDYLECSRCKKRKAT